MGLEITVSVTDDEGDEQEYTFPAMWEVCSDCEGDGKELIEGLKGVAFTESEFKECFEADEDRAAYFNSKSHYHVPCSACKGRTTVKVVNEAALSAAQLLSFREYQEVKDRNDKEEAYFCRCEAAERRMGALAQPKRIHLFRLGSFLS